MALRSCIIWKTVIFYFSMGILLPKIAPKGVEVYKIMIVMDLPLPFVEKIQQALTTNTHLRV